MSKNIEIRVGDQTISKKFAYIPKYLHEQERYIFWAEFWEVKTWNGEKYITYRKLNHEN